MKGEVPPWYQQDGVIGGTEEERELNEKADVPKWIHTQEPESGECPYCGLEYERVTWASNREESGGMPIYDTRETDFILRFVHSEIKNGRSRIPRRVCSPRYDDTLVDVSLTSTPDYKLEELRHV